MTAIYVGTTLIKEMGHENNLFLETLYEIKGFGGNRLVEELRIPVSVIFKHMKELLRQCECDLLWHTVDSCR